MTCIVMSVHLFEHTNANTSLVVSKTRTANRRVVSHPLLAELDESNGKVQL